MKKIRWRKKPCEKKTPIKKAKEGKKTGKKEKKSPIQKSRGEIKEKKETNLTRSTR